MEKNNLILWSTAAVIMACGIITIPSKGVLNMSQQAITRVNRQIADVKATDPASILDNSQQYNLQQIESKANQQLAEGVGLAMGGIHSADDLKNNQNKLIGDLGSKSNVNKLVKQTISRNENKYLAKQNDNVSVSFGDTNDISKIPVTIVTQYTQQDNTAKYYIITASYNGQRQKLNTGISVKGMLKKTPTTVTSGGDQ
ncbi:hypothetical protein [uncultured Limosilactobacillus sp.]|uniref:hypothetical protein n=1 Tax=uncultured Limosilactobacillus sp. TaxID=2837629 RepID=UPI0025F672B3|nr:hypothetical protein [uncultured Limosilactobacillus sp.]